MAATELENPTLSVADAEADMTRAVSALVYAIKSDLDAAKRSLGKKEYEDELIRIAYTNRSNSASSSVSPRNLIEQAWREEALRRLSRRAWD